MEWLAWGHQWQLGYPKHPPFPAWLAAAFHNFTPGSLIGVYLLSYLAVAFTLWCVWRVAREIVPPRVALLSALCLEGYLLFNLEGADYSNNIVLCATWMATVLSLQQALKSDALRWWLALGLSVGLSALTKYSIAFLVAPLIAFTIIEPRTRIIWRRKGVYLAAGLAVLIFVPHLVWMWVTNFTTIEYALRSAAGYQHWYDRLLFPTIFLIDQSVRIVPVLLIIAPVVSLRGGEPPTTDAYDRRFLAFAFLGPILLLIATSAVFGFKLRDVWGMPHWSLLGLFLLANSSERAVEGKALRRACAIGAIVVAAMSAISVTRNIWFAEWRGRPYREHYPGQALATQMTLAYHARYGIDPAIIAGEAWIANNVVCYSRRLPVVYPTVGFGYLDLKEKYAPWTSDGELRTRGGILVWELDLYGAALPSSLQDRFPSAVDQPPLIVPYQGGSHFASVHVGWAVVPPLGR